VLADMKIYARILHWNVFGHGDKKLCYADLHCGYSITKINIQTKEGLQWIER
jgi:hypothetical protein